LICLATRAVHIELVSDLTTEAFIAALRRFISRRGHCATILSDNGTNFVGADRELNELRALFQSDEHNEKIQSFLTDRKIQWRFNPPNSPHFGGLWEAAVKSFKRHLIRVVGTEVLIYEHFNTLVIEIEAILNSRPITPISSDPNDPPVLARGHFLIGDALTSLHERDFRDIPPN
jgi:transposase InsO family protein